MLERPLVAVIVATFVVLCSCKKTSAPSAADTVCKSDDDCVISCESRGSCCHNPYCDAVVHRAIAADAVAFNEARCKPADFEKCPQIGARAERTFTITPRCRAGACMAEQIPRKPVSEGGAP
jgi:hypothetical protein